jgi:hypothetical protein
MNIIRLLISLALLILQLKGEELNEKGESDDYLDYGFDDGDNKTAAYNDLIFEHVYGRCRMFEYDCKMSFKISKRINLETLSVESANQNLVKVKSINVCREGLRNESIEKTEIDSVDNIDSKITYKKCDLLRTNSSSSYLDAHIYFSPIVVGKTELSFSYKRRGPVNSSSILYGYNFIVTQPRRFIDRVFDVWVWIFQTVISCLMGILLDVESLKKLLMFPKQVVVGFCSQYICMPLVNIQSC